MVRYLAPAPLFPVAGLGAEQPGMADSGKGAFGRPSKVSDDHRSEFVAKAVQGRIAALGAKTARIAPGGS